MWDKPQFEAFLKENPTTEDQQNTLAEIAEKMNLTAMEQPWEYIKALQASFDYNKIKYTEDFYDPDMNPAAQPAAPEWKVYFEGNFWGHHGRVHAGTQIRIGKEFDWAGYHWIIPSAYSCGRGLVMDFCMRVEPDQIHAFIRKWNLNVENDSCKNFSREQQMELELDNPLCFNFAPHLMLNGKSLRASHGCSVCFNPCIGEDLVSELEGKWAVEHYGLDASYGWVICRNAFPWAGKRRPQIETLSLVMEQQPVSIPGPHFTVKSPGDSFRFVHPVSQTEYTLTVQELEQKTIPETSFGSSRWRYPTHLTAMSYTLSPESSQHITISDCADSDKPVELSAPNAPDAYTPIASIAVIGGASGATAVVAGNRPDKLNATCSALHFKPIQRTIEWRITFHEKMIDDYAVNLVQS